MVEPSSAAKERLGSVIRMTLEIGLLNQSAKALMFRRLHIAGVSTRRGARSDWHDSKREDADTGLENPYYRLHFRNGIHE